MKKERGKNMKHCKMILLIFLLLVVAFSANAKADYATGLVFNGFIQSGTGDLDAGGYSAPTVYDWNSDGKEDLIVGNKGTSNSASVRFYQNTGTDDAPTFNNGSTNIMTCSAPCTIGGG